MNKVSKRLAEDLLTLVLHAKNDIGFQEGGSYCKEGKLNDPDYIFDKKGAKASERAIEYLTREFISQHYVT